MGAADETDVESWIGQRHLSLHWCLGNAIHGELRNTKAVWHRLTCHLRGHGTRRSVLTRNSKILTSSNRCAIGSQSSCGALLRNAIWKTSLLWILSGCPL